LSRLQVFQQPVQIKSNTQLHGHTPGPD
jgi:hypothetical protein